jgi:hypothetical protein
LSALTGGFIVAGQRGWRADRKRTQAQARSRVRGPERGQADRRRVRCCRPRSSSHRRCRSGVAAHSIRRHSNRIHSRRPTRAPRPTPRPNGRPSPGRPSDPP